MTRALLLLAVQARSGITMMLLGLLVLIAVPAWAPSFPHAPNAVESGGATSVGVTVVPGHSKPRLPVSGAPAGRGGVG